LRSPVVGCLVTFGKKITSMKSEVRKIMQEVTDRRVLKNPAEQFLDYWTTYAVTGMCVAYYFSQYSGTKYDALVLMIYAPIIAVTAARDGKKEVHRKLDALVRRLVEKKLL